MRRLAALSALLVLAGPAAAAPGTMSKLPGSGTKGPGDKVLDAVFSPAPGSWEESAAASVQSWRDEAARRAAADGEGGPSPEDLYGVVKAEAYAKWQSDQRAQEESRAAQVESFSSTVDPIPRPRPDAGDPDARTALVDVAADDDDAADYAGCGQVIATAFPVDADRVNLTYSELLERQRRIAGTGSRALEATRVGGASPYFDRSDPLLGQNDADLRPGPDYMR